MPDASRAESFGPLLGDLDQSLWDMMSATALKYPERQAVASLWQPSSHCLVLPDKSAPESESVRWTYQQLLHASGILATSLSKLGCKPNMKLAAVLWNSVEWCLLFWATAKLRMTFVPIDPRNPNDAKSMLACSKPDVIVAQSGKEACSLQPYTAATDPSVLLVHCSQDEIRGWRTIHSLLSENFSQTSDTSVSSGNKTLPAPDRSAYVALVVFTSGTTGAPKGCLHTNRNLISQTCEYDPNGDPEEIDRWLVHTPVSHIFAINNTLRAWKTGGVVVFAAKSFDVKASLMGIQEEKCTIMPATPTLVKALLASPEFSEEKGSSLEIVSIAATTIRPDDIERCRRLGARHAVQAYGLSEGAPILSLPRNDELLRKGFHHGVGKVLPGAAVRICDPETRTVLCRTRVGELHVSGSSVISAYLNNENKDSFYEDEHGHWLITGDQGMMDEQGIVHINGRYKDMIIRGGENINPAKIETALMEFKDVEV
jgi:acyl-CoA synthetase (AMP-forming)/AMP-acid ligase II